MESASLTVGSPVGHMFQLLSGSEVQLRPLRVAASLRDLLEGLAELRVSPREIGPRAHFRDLLASEQEKDRKDDDPT